MKELRGEATLLKNGTKIFEGTRVFFTVEPVTLDDKRGSTFNVFKKRHVVVGIIEHAVLDETSAKELSGKDIFDDGEIMVVKTEKNEYKIKNIVLMDYIKSSVLNNVEFQGVLVSEDGI